VAEGFDVVLVVTGLDKKRGRGALLTPTPVKTAAQELGIAVTHDVNDILQVDADVGVVVAYGRLIRRPILEHLPMVNLHFSLLPRWRGAAPVERALLAGDHETGVALMALEEGLDTGPLFAVESVPITESTTGQSLRSELTEVGTRLLVESLEAGLGEPTPQRGEPVYAAKLDPGELRIDWTRDARSIDRLVRLGGAWTMFRGRRVKVLAAGVAPATDSALSQPGQFLDTRVRCGTGALALQAVQPEGKGRMDAVDWIRGARLTPTDRLE
jgi:methionyl-tRNA formyltransferase